MATFKHSLLLIGFVTALLLGWIAITGVTHAAAPGDSAAHATTAGSPAHAATSPNVATALTLKLREPDVALTDYGLAIECSVFAFLLFPRRNRRSRLGTWFALFFLSTGVASLIGGTTHGFFPDGTTGERILWPMTMLAIGFTGLTMWLIGARLLSSRTVARWLSMLATAAFCIYCAIVLFVNQIFLVAIVDYLPATIFLLAIFAIRYARHREPPILVGVLGLLLTFVAAYVQQARIGLNPMYFNHNALYHLIQAVALGMFFLSARRLTVPRAAEDAPRASSEYALS